MVSVASYWRMRLLFCFFLEKGGQTLGMRAWKIGIEDFQDMSWWQSLSRFMVGLVSTVLLGIGLWVKKFNKSGLSWMDRICGHRTVNVNSPATSNL
jgi:RDD family.